jgi:hypothetical protein
VLNHPAADGDVSGHDGHGDDIIPPFTYEEGGATKQYRARNWGPSGQAIFANGCNVPGTRRTRHLRPRLRRRRPLRRRRRLRPLQRLRLRHPTTTADDSATADGRPVDHEDRHAGSGERGRLARLHDPATNGSAQTATGVTVTDQLPAGVTWSPSAPARAAARPVDDHCQLGSLAAGATRRSRSSSSRSPPGCASPTLATVGGIQPPTPAPSNNSAVAERPRSKRRVSPRPRSAATALRVTHGHSPVGDSAFRIRCVKALLGGHRSRVLRSPRLVRGRMASWHRAA